jgi:predicted outer membrane protein
MALTGRGRYYPCMQTLRRSQPLLCAAAALLGVIYAAPAMAQAYPPPGTPPVRPGPPSFAAPITPPPNRVADELTPRSANGLPGRDTENVINKISQLTSEQLRISQIAATRAINRQVRTFAEELQNTTQDLQQEIDRMAQAKSILVPTGKSSSEMAEEERNWQGKDSKELDQDYIDRVTKLHKDAIEALEEYAKDKDMDPEIVTFANRHLPALREHLRQAESLKRQVDE